MSESVTYFLLGMGWAAVVFRYNTGGRAWPYFVCGTAGVVGVLRQLLGLLFG